MIHHITLSQLRTFTPPATQFGADNEPYMVIQVNRDPMDFQQLTSFLYEFAYPIPASREDLLMTSAYLSNINNGSREGFTSAHPRLLLISKLSGQSIYNLDPAPSGRFYFTLLFTSFRKQKELTLMYIIIPTHGHYEIRDGPTFIQSADTYREAWHELASLTNSLT
jgi:hypothetical protein